jgi:ribulose 1,5-bisphosphate synthetase/thiazole synthase
MFKQGDISIQRSLSMSENYDVIVVGGGHNGLTAHAIFRKRDTKYLLPKGWKKQVAVRGQRRLHSRIQA